MYVCQIITLYTFILWCTLLSLNLHRVIRQLYLNNTGKFYFAFTVLPAFVSITKTYNIVFLFFLLWQYYCQGRLIKYILFNYFQLKLYILERKKESEVAQYYPTLWPHHRGHNPRGSSQCRDWILVSHTTGCLSHL